MAPYKDEDSGLAYKKCDPASSHFGMMGIGRPYLILSPSTKNRTKFQCTLEYIIHISYDKYTSYDYDL